MPSISSTSSQERPRPASSARSSASLRAFFASPLCKEGTAGAAGTAGRGKAGQVNEAVAPGVPAQQALNHMR